MKIVMYRNVAEVHKLFMCTVYKPYSTITNKLMEFKFQISNNYKITDKFKI